MEVKTLREKQKQTPVSGRDQCDGSAFKEDTGGQRTRLGWRGEMARGLSVAGEHSLSALQADSVTQCGCHLTWVPQEHSRKIMTAEGLGPPLEQRSLTAWLTLETQPSPQPGPHNSRSTSQLLLEAGQPLSGGLRQRGRGLGLGQKERWASGGGTTCRLEDPE